jgi:hypothetical protein
MLPTFPSSISLTHSLLPKPTLYPIFEELNMTCKCDHIFNWFFLPKSGFLIFYLNLQWQKSLRTWYLPHPKSKTYEINSIKSCSLRSFQQYQMHIPIPLGFLGLNWMADFQVWPCFQLIFPSKTWFFVVYLNFNDENHLKFNTSPLLRPNLSK